MVEILTGGMRWRVTPECRGHLLGPAGFRLQEWRETGQAVAVKHSPHRTVYRVNLPGLTFYLKHNRVIDFRTWVRQLVRPSKAAMEFERAVAVADCGIPTAMPLGMGERIDGWGPGDNFFITRCLEDTEPLSTFIEQTLVVLETRRQVLVRQRLARELAGFIAQIHEAGVLHNDLHAGNILVRLEAEDRPRLFLIDLHGVKIGRSLGWTASRANLVVLSHWFMIHAGRTDRLRFWRSYLQARHKLRIKDRETGSRNGINSRKDAEAQRSLGGIASLREIFRIPLSSILDLRSSNLPLSSLELDLEARSWRSTLRLWRARESRYLTWNRAFEPISSGVARGHVIRDFDRQALLALFADPDAPFRRPDVNILKDSPSSTVIEYDMQLNGVSCRVVYKRFRVKSWFDPITAWFRRPAAMRSWIFGQGLRECGLPTPRPLAVLFRRRFGLSFEGYLLTEKIANVRELHQFVADLAATDGTHILRSSIDQVARLVRDLHSRQLSHRDLKAANILVANDQVSGEPGCVSARSQEAGIRGQGSGVRSQESGVGEPSTVAQQTTDQCDGATHHSSLITHDSLAATHHSPLPIHSSPRVWLIDLVGVKRHRRLSRRRRVQNLARLHASFVYSTALTRTDKLRFLRTYLQWSLVGRDGWQRWWCEIEIATRAKIARTTRLRRPLG
jgi:tRNA A-37 threonylcarbamoyl transferase component Bud32